MKRHYVKHLSQAIDQTEICLDGIIKALGGDPTPPPPPFPSHPKTVVTYENGDVTEYEIEGLLHSEQIDHISNAVGIEIGTTVTGIQYNAFYGAGKLTNVAIPSSVANIDNSSLFYTTHNISSILIDPQNSVYDSRNNCNAIIKTDDNKLMYGCKNTIIPNGVTSIGGYAFEYCYGLESITIPTSVTSIGDYAFCECSSLLSVTIPTSAIEIGSAVFYGCGLSSITIPTSVTSIASEMFYGCSALTSITIPTSVTKIDNEAFSNCSNLSSVTIPTSITSIAYSTFNECKKLSSITIPSSVIEINDSAFYGCGLSSITIPDSVTNIGEYAFGGCSNLRYVTIQNTIETIGLGAFEECSKLDTITFNGMYMADVEDMDNFRWGTEERAIVCEDGRL